MWEAIAGGIFGGVLDSLGQVRANRDNKDMAYQQMNFQKDMSNTSYQRALADMSAAGLNPMLAYSQGGASTPSGAASVSQNPHYGAGLSNAMQNRVLEAGIDKAAAETGESYARTALSALQADNIQAQTRLTLANADSEGRRLRLLQSDVGRREVEDVNYGWRQTTRDKELAADVNRKEMDYYRQALTVDPDIRRFLAQAANEELTAKQDSEIRRRYSDTLPFMKYAPLGGGAAVAADMLDAIRRKRGADSKGNRVRPWDGKGEDKRTPEQGAPVEPFMF